MSNPQKQLKAGTESHVNTTLPTKVEQAPLIDEFEIIELEQRLELVDRCNISCGVKPK